MTEAHKSLLGSIGCGVRIEDDDRPPPAVWCSHDGPRCHWCQVKRDVCDELTTALEDSALVDTAERIWLEANQAHDPDISMSDDSLRRDLRYMLRSEFEHVGIELKRRPEVKVSAL